MYCSWTALALLLSAQGSLALGPVLTCGNEQDRPEPMPARPDFRRPFAVENVKVDLYMHIASTKANKDMITEKVVADQIEILQETYLKYGFELNHVNTSRVVDDKIATGFFYANGTEDKEGYYAHRKATRRGGYDALNLFFFSDLGWKALGGRCTFPIPSSKRTDYNVTMDGCLVNGLTMPGLSTAAKEHNGNIAVHEAGHWFNLLHTFSGGPCDPINDEVNDTPAQGNPTMGGCPVGKDTCPDIEGLDPIHNYMDYADDSCMNEFTPGQKDRMHDAFDLYRRP